MCQRVTAIATHGTHRIWQALDGYQDCYGLRVPDGHVGLLIARTDEGPIWRLSWRFGGANEVVAGSSRTRNNASLTLEMRRVAQSVPDWPAWGLSEGGGKQLTVKGTQCFQ